MQKENLDRVVEIRERLRVLDREIDYLIDIMPPTKESQEYAEWKKCLFRKVKLFRRKKSETQETVMKESYWEILLNNEDVWSLIENRSCEKLELEDELKRL